MNKEWPTKETDMDVAQQILEQYAETNEKESLGLFELTVSEKEQRFQFRLSDWVTVLAEYFKSQYGAEQGDFVTRQIISRYMTQGQTVH